MKNVLAGAGVAMLLGLVTGMVGWRWAYLQQQRYTELAVQQNNVALQDSNSTIVDSVLNQSITNHSNRVDGLETRRLNITRPNNISAVEDIWRTNISSTNLTGVTSVNSSTSPSLSNLSTVKPASKGLTASDPFNETTALNSSLFLETNDTEVFFRSEDPNRNTTLPRNSTEDDIDYIKMGQEMLTEATTILDTGIWDFERRTEDGDAIFSRQLDNGNMVYRLTGIVDMPPQDLLVIIWDGLADYPKWNPSLLECRVLEKINDQTDISYTVSAPGARGYVASRDFISLRHWEMRHNSYILASKSIDFSTAPSNPDYIRGKNGPGCMELRPLSSDPSKTEFRWLLNTKLNGWIPSYIADKAYKKFMTKYMIFLREYCKKIKQRVTPTSTTPRNITG